MVMFFNDAEPGLLSRIPESAICVQRLDDSRNSAIHIMFRISLRSSSMREPRDPLLKVVLGYIYIIYISHFVRLEIHFFLSEQKF